MESSTKKEEKQLLLDLRYLRMARIWAENSYCHRRKVGALVVKEKMIISDGYNGTPSGFENICEDHTNTTKPCIECAKLIIQAGIKRVIYAEQYRLMDGIDLLKRANIEVTYLNPDDYEYEEV